MPNLSLALANATCLPFLSSPRRCPPGDGRRDEPAPSIASEVWPFGRPYLECLLNIVLGFGRPGASIAARAPRETGRFRGFDCDLRKAGAPPPERLAPWL